MFLFCYKFPSKKGNQSMNRTSQIKKLKLERELLIKELENFYLRAFDRIAKLELKEQDIAKLTQLLLLSREAAINSLKKEIEQPLITGVSKNQ